MTGYSTDKQLLNNLGATLTVLAGRCGLAGNFGMEKGSLFAAVGL